MSTNQSIDFFDKQFLNQPKEVTLRLNPFEEMALPYLRGDVLDFGSGMGNLSFEAAKRGCKVLALDGSPAAIEYIQIRARNECLNVSASLADLRTYSVNGEYDCIVSIGLLMFFDCPTAFRVLAELQDRVRPGGVAVINVLIEGTTYFDMFDSSGHCLFDPTELERRFSGWTIEKLEYGNFEAPRQSIKRFCTIIACRPIQ